MMDDTADATDDRWMMDDMADANNDFAIAATDNNGDKCILTD